MQPRAGGGGGGDDAGDGVGCVHVAVRSTKEFGKGLFVVFVCLLLLPLCLLIVVFVGLLWLLFQCLSVLFSVFVCLLFLSRWLLIVVPRLLFMCLSLLFEWQCVLFWTPLAVTGVLLWLIYRPDYFPPRVDSAVLAALDVIPAAANANATSQLLQYDLAVDMSFRNSHRRLTSRYFDVGATAFYNGTKLAPADDALPAPFRQGPKNTTVLQPSFRGAVAVDGGVAAELERERAAGTVHVRVSVALTLMYKVSPAKEVFFYKYDCWLWFPPPANNTPAVFSAGTQCLPSYSVFGSAAAGRRGASTRAQAEAALPRRAGPPKRTRPSYDVAS